MNKEETKKSIPKLRFPIFRNQPEWAENVLGGKGIAEFVRDKVSVKELKLENYITTENLLPDYGGVVPISKLPPAGSFTKFLKGDILISNIRPYLKKIWVADIDGAASNDVIVIRAGSKIDKSFLAFLLKNDDFIGYVMRGAKGVKMPRGDKSQIEKYPIFLPAKIEQQQIASCFASIEELIIAQNRKLELVREYKKSMVQQLFPEEGKTIPRLRFQEFSKDSGWKSVRLSDVLKEHGTKSTGKEDVFSVSVHKGLVNQIDHLGRSFSAASTSHYKCVFPGDIVYTKSPTGDFPFGIIKQSKITYDVIVSPLYGVFTPLTYELGCILDAYFSSPVKVNNYLSSIVQKGAKNTINISNEVFLSKMLCLPVSIKEQKKIAGMLATIDNLIVILTQRVNITKEYKKGLMQLLLPISNNSINE
jgi:type I restriction enzyme, S subunit